MHIPSSNAAQWAYLIDVIPVWCTSLQPDAKGIFGKMNAWQMVEHLSDSLRTANGKDPHTCLTPPENLPKMQAFLFSDKPFRDNTPNQLLPDIPPPPRNTTFHHAIDELRGELRDFEKHFKNHPGRMVTNPFFGELDETGWLRLLTKHFLHHQRQFGVV
jgi:hypothetical protein